MTRQPYFVAGSGHLISHVNRHATEVGAREYQFNLYRVGANGEATSWLQPEDLRDLIKACQVLAFSIADDGWIESTLHRQLTELAEDLQQITDRWEQQNA